MIVKQVASNVVDDELIEQEVLETPESDQSEEVKGLDLTTEELVALAAEIVVAIRCRKYDERTRREFAERYKFIATTALKVIGFDRALQQVPIKMLPPEHTLILGIALLVGLGFLLPVGVNEKPLEMGTNIPKSEEKRDVSSKESTSGEVKGNVREEQVEEVMDVLQKLKKM